MAALALGPTKPIVVSNASIVLITPNNRVILVRDRRTQEWMTPGGKRDHPESEFECALREFQEETSFVLDPKYFTNMQSFPRVHRNKSITMIYIIHSIQRFPKYDQSKVKHHETDALYYLKLNDLKKLVLNDIPHGDVTILKGSVKKSLHDLIDKNII